MLTLNLHRQLDRFLIVVDLEASIGTLFYVTRYFIFSRLFICCSRKIAFLWWVSGGITNIWNTYLNSKSSNTSWYIASITFALFSYKSPQLHQFKMWPHHWHIFHSKLQNSSQNSKHFLRRKTRNIFINLCHKRLRTCFVNSLFTATCFRLRLIFSLKGNDIIENTCLVSIAFLCSRSILIPYFIHHCFVKYNIVPPFFFSLCYNYLIVLKEEIHEAYFLVGPICRAVLYIKYLAAEASNCIGVTEGFKKVIREAPICIICRNDILFW